MKHSPQYKELETGFVIVLALIVVYIRYPAKYLLPASLAIGLSVLFVPFIRRNLYKGWTALAEGLGAIVSRILMIIIFIVIVIPLGFITRSLGKTSIRFKKTNPSYFKDRNHLYSKEDLENPW